MTKPRASLAVCSASSVGVALAACSFELAAVGDDGTIEMQLTPAGAFRPSDGREMEVPAWVINQAIAARVIARFEARKNPPVVDYEHQTLNKETNGQPAPAAAWMRALQWREGSGLWAIAEVTARAADHIRGGEYRFVSPVFRFDPETGEVLSIEMAALTNHPAIDGMEPLALRAAATFGYSPTTEEDESPMKLLAALIAALALPQTTTEDEAIAACSALKIKLDNFQGVAKIAGVEDVGDGTAVLAACTNLQTQANANKPDPSKFVSTSVVEELRGQIAALSAQHVDREVNELVTAGLADGRLLPAQKDWAIELGKSNLAALSAYLKSAEPIAALRGTQTGGDAPAGVKDENGLTAGELAVCTATGIDPKDFAAAKAA